MKTYKTIAISLLTVMATTNIKAQAYGDEGPILTPNRLGLVYESAIEKNEDGKVNIRRVNYKPEFGISRTCFLP